MSFVTAVGGDFHANSYTSIAFIYYYEHLTRDKESGFTVTESCEVKSVWFFFFFLDFLLS